MDESEKTLGRTQQQPSSNAACHIRTPFVELAADSLPRHEPRVDTGTGRRWKKKCEKKSAPTSPGSTSLTE